MLSRMGESTESRSAGGGAAGCESAAADRAAALGAWAAVELAAAVVVTAGLPAALSVRAAAESQCMLSAAAVGAAGVAPGGLAATLGDGVAGALLATGAAADLARAFTTYHAPPPPRTTTASTMKAVRTMRPAPESSTCVGVPAMSGVGRRPGCRVAGVGVVASTVPAGVATGRLTVGALGCGVAMASVPVLESALAAWWRRL